MYKLCVSKLCVYKLCVGKLCVSELRVGKLCVKGRREEGGPTEVHNQKQETHTMMWGKMSKTLIPRTTFGS